MRIKKGFILGAFLLIGAFFAFFSFWDNAPKKLYRLVPPADKLLTLELSGKVSQYQFTGTLKCRPRPFQNGISYYCQFTDLEISDKRTIIEYRQINDHDHLYRTDPSWSELDRERIFSAFNIDLTNDAPSDDGSLIRQPLTIFINDLGQIGEVILTKSLRRALLAVVGNSPASILLQEAFNNPQNLPPLMPNKKALSSWHTAGTFLIPINFIHYKSGGTINTRTTLQQGSSPSGFSNNYALLNNHKLAISDFSWSTKWDYDEDARVITQLSSQFFICLSSEFLGNISEQAYTCELEARASFSDLPPIIAEAPLF